MAAPEPQLAGVLGAAVDQIDVDEKVVIVRTLRVHVNVGMLDLYRNDVRRLGLAVPCAHNKGDTRVFVGTAFAPEAMKFFGPPPDGADAEAYLQECYKILNSQKSVVDYVNSCDDRKNDPKKKWVFGTREKELGDFNELLLEFKEACPIFFDEETGAPFYQEQNFAAAFIDCIRRRNPELKCKTHIQKLCKKRRLLRKADAVVKAARRADAVAAATVLVARGRVVDAVLAAARDPAAAALAEPAEEPAPDAAPDANQPPAPAPEARTAASLGWPGGTAPAPAADREPRPLDASPSPRAKQKRPGAARRPPRHRANPPGARAAARPRRRAAGGAPARALQPSPDTSPSPATEVSVGDADAAELQRMLATAEARAADVKKRADGLGAQLAEAKTRWKAGDERAKAAEEERDRLKVRAEALAADFAAANAFAETANARVRAAEQDRDRQKARADAAEARVRELEEKLRDRADRALGDDTE
ncbi:unnamed protein product [Pelagomonas calceolata]|uniref:Uncharacterized protein n=2 Tax=Pelagomonas calceolata TaxID=35677 RepID=A0A8J2SUG6_9STRA|nr:unnamed protein product [Pelagomonas calceolata]